MKITSMSDGVSLWIFPQPNDFVDTNYHGFLENDETDFVGPSDLGTTVYSIPTDWHFYLTFNVLTNNGGGIVFESWASDFADEDMPKLINEWVPNGYEDVYN